ncbi:hypothetical protein [Paraflavitalea speifideaquila]|uniref:hypothetical protein n=1 Tax=Paraflavitalea speifideaquila TaxID=3076558 RepID=UPI0028F0F5CC|nr:hypothetical protein [Paraflavitalea speifideiaquila]
MTNSFWDKFRLQQEKENADIVIDNIDKGVVFKGTNLWVLIFAIFIASLGLNVNSTAVIIGAMLIPPYGSHHGHRPGRRYQRPLPAP